MLNARLEQFAQRDLVMGWSDEERRRIEKSIANLRLWLENKAEVADTMVFGSWTRNTILPRKYDAASDIDLMVVFEGSLSSLEPEWCRDRLREFVSKGYPLSYVRKDAPAVKLELNFIKYDLVPAVRDEWWGDYYIPNTSACVDGWMHTTPKDLDPMLARLNSDIGNNIVRNVIRLCKYMCKSRISVPSYELESHVINGIKSISYFTPKRTYDYFLEVVRQIAKQYGLIQDEFLQTILSRIDVYRERYDKEGQIRWMQHLLPAFSA